MAEDLCLYKKFHPDAQLSDRALLTLDNVGALDHQASNYHWVGPAPSTDVPSHVPVIEILENSLTNTVRATAAQNDPHADQRVLSACRA